MNDKFTIRLKIAGRTYPLNIRREDEERIRAAARKVDKEFATYKERFNKGGNNLDESDYLAMIAFHFALEYTKIVETRGDETVTHLLESLNQDLDNYIGAE